MKEAYWQCHKKPGSNACAKQTAMQRLWQCPDTEEGKCPCPAAKRTYKAVMSDETKVGNGFWQNAVGDVNPKKMQQDSAAETDADDKCFAS